MRKKGDVLFFAGVVIAVLVVILLAAGIYFYNFYVFKTVRVCVGDATDTFVPCGATQDCVDYVTLAGLEIDLNDTPVFVRDNFQKVLDEAVYCDGSCFVKNIRGVNLETQELEMLDSCEEGEVEFVVEIRGKDAFEIWRWMENMD